MLTFLSPFFFDLDQSQPSRGFFCFLSLDVCDMILIKKKGDSQQEFTHKGTEASENDEEAS